MNHTEFMEFLTKADVPYQIRPIDPDNDKNDTVVRIGNWHDQSREDLSYDGYSCFYSEWTFDASGRLVSVAHWE